MTATNKHQYHAVLEEWSVIPSTNGILGVIFQDETKRFNDGEVVRTSTIKPYQYLVEGNIVETKNTRYLLGKRRGLTFDDGAVVTSTREDQLESLCAFMKDKGYFIVYSDSSVFFRKEGGCAMSFAKAVRWHNRADELIKSVKKVKIQRVNNRLVVQSHKVEYINQDHQPGCQAQ
ncbi:hypothetical protein pf16_198 [Pseudomonas phage pf16]|uniref:DUF7390 domain-containing protein n=1 Tax=Pseudomonas phage pf16 TaxID=1815630 RepID=A0A1S5R3X8_9CAUD|nr:hypothetical protein FDG98_gp100 [Pseudomonas phage pf16]AND75121.1 hypothetical protein pf16_198 [Pseudomonas phage pf16]